MYKAKSDIHKNLSLYYSNMKTNFGKIEKAVFKLVKVAPSNCRDATSPRSS